MQASKGSRKTLVSCIANRMSAASDSAPATPVFSPGGVAAVGVGKRKGARDDNDDQIGSAGGSRGRFMAA